MVKPPSLFQFKSLIHWAYSISRFNQYGLMRHDLLHETPEVTEALRRCPEHLVDARNFRIIRAMQLEMQKKVLPKEEWLTLEQDELYLQPYLEEVYKEKLEKQQWDNK